MEGQPSIKLQRKPSMDTEPRTLSKDDYELAWAAASVAYMQRENKTTVTAESGREEADLRNQVDD
ncbi:hypothetical protein FNV43_RR10748 [Rhamnella rubrinervis]|uniref:Uncharacterized protein n=1 Tax=Rhamnella rubrinervis TaxID=2594499 RepID=A0A8K0H4F8_9ROSA|nr:hypothetical protein FNV43_RR10748 [Rhamnella rubrinervis]